MTAVPYAPPRIRTMADALREEGPLPVARVRGIALQLLDALEAAHATGVVHGNVQPGAVQLLDDDRAVLLLTVAGGAAEPTRAGDLVSLGATLFAAVAGRPGSLRPAIEALLNPAGPGTLPQVRTALST